MNSSEKIFLTEVECFKRYGFSRSWFQRCRWSGEGPEFLKVKSKILYPLEATDNWFMSHGLKSSTSEVKKQ